MTFRNRLFVTHLATAVFSGVFFWLMNRSPVGNIFYLYALAIPLTVIFPAIGAHLWLMKGLRKITVRLEARESLADLRTGISELDELAQAMCDVVDKNREGWNSLQRLLGQLTTQNSQDGAKHNVELNGKRLSQALARVSRAVAAEVGRILNLINEISQRSHETTIEAKTQTNTIGQTIHYVEQLSSNIDLILGNAESANKSAIDACQAAAQGQELIEKLIIGMRRIRSYVETGERKVLSLGERSQEIGSIVETMGTLSARTDMLALNASIEAIRAGEQGRGFAIVAEEVRKLAEHTNNASREIADLIESMRAETQDTITAMAEERAQVQEEVARVNEAGGALAKIRETSSASAERVGEISRITMEQLRGTQEMIQAMQQVSAISEDVYERASKVRQTTTEVISVTRDLEHWISPMFHCDHDERRVEFSDDISQSAAYHSSPGSFDNVRNGSPKLQPMGVQQ